MRICDAPGEGRGDHLPQTDTLRGVYRGAAAALLPGADGGQPSDAAIRRCAQSPCGRERRGGAVSGAGHPERPVCGAGGHGCGGALMETGLKGPRNGRDTLDSA